MNTIFITGLDKISIKRFIQFILKYLNDYQVGTLHYLMSEESINYYIEDFSNKFQKRIFSYFLRKSGDSIPNLPTSITDSADLIIWFDLYSTKPIVKQSKTEPHILKGALMDWARHIEKLEKGGL